MHLPSPEQIEQLKQELRRRYPALADHAIALFRRLEHYVPREKLLRYVFLVVPTKRDLDESKQWVRGQLTPRAALDILCWGFPASLLLLAILPGLPYDYYHFLRFSTCLFAMVAALRNAFSPDAKTYWYPIFGAILLAYNPLFQLYLSHGLWAPINILSGAAFIGHYAQYRKLRKNAPQEPESD